MVFMESQQLGWRPLKDSFLQSLPSTLFAPDQISSLDDMFEWLVPACMKHVRTSTLSVPYSELHIFNSMLTILRATLGVDLEQAASTAGASGQQGLFAGVFLRTPLPHNSPIYNDCQTQRNSKIFDAAMRMGLQR